MNIGPIIYTKEYYLVFSLISSITGTFYGYAKHREIVIFAFDSILV